MSQQKLFKPKEYEIKTIDDFRKIPLEKIDKCLKEFAIALKSRKHMEEAMNSIGKQISGLDKVLDLTIPRFIWIDDKENRLTFNLINQKPCQNSVKK